MKIEHIGFVEAVERLADRVGVQLTYEGGGSSVTARPGHPHPAAGGQQARPPSSTPRSCAPRRRRPRSQFLTARGFDAAAAERFGCGYAPAGWDTLTKHLLAARVRARRADEGRAVPGGPAAARSTGSTAGCCGRSGTSAATWSASARAGSSTTTGIEAKYLNTAETPVYHKTQVLFGLDLAKREIAKRRQVVVVEGYTDVMAMHLAGRAHRRRVLRHGVRRRAHRA